MTLYRVSVCVLGYYDAEVEAESAQSAEEAAREEAANEPPTRWSVMDTAAASEVSSDA